MTLHRALAGYLVVLHVLMAVLLGFALWERHRPWILLLEACVLVSAIVGWRLLRAVSMPHELVRIGREWMREGDFSHTFRPLGTGDMRQLIELHNKMLGRLREEHVRAEEQDIFLHKVLGASPSGVLATDHDGRLNLANPAAERLLGVETSACLGLPLEEVPALQPLCEVDVGESRLLGHTGGRRLRCTRSVFYDRGFPRQLFMVEDLTHELWKTEKQAYHVLIRTLSHEINNTHGATRSILQSSLRYGDQLRPSDRDDFVSALQVAIERSDNLGAFMRRYAEVVRVPPPSRQPVDLGELLERMVSLVEPECTQRDIALSLEVDGDPQPVHLDVVQMEQVLVNVLRNAIEAVDREGRIRIRVSFEPSAAALVIEDSGPGLSTEARANVFTPFFSDKPSGQGVGLTLAKEILTLHGFDFALESPPGGPTRFVIRMAR